MFVEKYLKELRRARFSPRAIASYVRSSSRQSLEAGLARTQAFRGLTLVGSALLALNLGLALLVSSALDHDTARELFLGMTFWLAGSLVWILLHLGMMRDSNNLPATGIGIPNTITVVRILSIPAFFTFMTHGHFFAGTTAFVLGGCTDVLDGWVARHIGPRTHLGRMMDPMVDVLFNSGAILTFALCNLVPWWLFVLVWVRYAMLTFGATWIYLFRGPINVKPTLLGRISGLFSGAFMLALLVVPHVLEPTRASQVSELIHYALATIFGVAAVHVVLLGLVNLRSLRDGSREAPGLQLVSSQAVERRNG